MKPERKTRGRLFKKRGFEMICVKELVKNFDDVCAVNNITLNIPEGEMLGLLGTNGAGKTTLLRMIAGVLEADGGSIVVDGANITSGDVSGRDFLFAG